MTRTAQLQARMTACVICACCLCLAAVGLHTWTNRRAAVQDSGDVVVHQSIATIVIAAIDAVVREGDRSAVTIEDTLSNDVGNIPGQFDEIAKMCTRHHAPSDLMQAVMSRNKSVVAKLGAFPEGVPYGLVSESGWDDRDDGFTVRASLPVLDRRSCLAVCIIACSPAEPTGGGVTAVLLARRDTGWQVVDHIVLAVY